MSDAARDDNLISRGVKDRSSSSSKMNSSNSKIQMHHKTATNSCNNSKSSMNQCQLNKLLHFWFKIQTFHYLIRKEMLSLNINLHSSRQILRSNLPWQPLKRNSHPILSQETEVIKVISRQVPQARKMTVSRHKRIKPMVNKLLLRVVPLPKVILLRCGPIFSLHNNQRSELIYYLIGYIL